MEDCCAVCADPLEWVAYGTCLHREVCSTCVVRLRFVLGDNKCCLCKVELATVFVTKALGDYTKVVSDFSVLPNGSSEGKVGSYWYHEDTQAYFDDDDHYKMIKDMCKLSCSICDRYVAETQGKDIPHRKDKFRNIEQLKKHLQYRHRVSMCDLCLEGRKVFMCEQKLYNRGQLNQHMSTGDSVVDGTESERGGFAGHPLCDFCQMRFYGDNELYMHMSTEHYTCHICQRAHPGQYDYFKNYDDLEIHFRHEHFLCEDEACLAKKFVVFISESEMKRHNAIEHGGNMSRSQRNAALQIPVSFRYRRSDNYDVQRGRGRGRARGPRHGDDTLDYDLSVAVEASMETANVSNSVPEHPSTARATFDADDHEEFPAPEPESSDPGRVVPSRYREALHNTRNVSLEESSFPPLPVVPKAPDRPGLVLQRHRRNRGAAVVLNSHKGRSSGNNSLASSSSTGSAWGVVPHARAKKQDLNRGTVDVLNSQTSSSYSAPVINSNGTNRSGPPASSSKLPEKAPAMPVTPHNPASEDPRPQVTTSLPVTEDVQAANRALVDRIRSGLDNSEEKFMAFKEVSAGYRQGQIDTPSYLMHVEQFGLLHPASEDPRPQVTTSLPVTEDVQAANRALVDRIRSGLDNSEEKFMAFKEVSTGYRQGQIDTPSYLMHVEQFGLLHLVVDLARLCPDPLKQKELLDAYNAKHNNAASSSEVTQVVTKKNAGPKKGKEKASAVFVENSSSKSSYVDDFVETVRRLHVNNKPQEGDVEVLSKDGYRRAAKGKAVVAPSIPNGLNINSSEQKFSVLRSGDGSRPPGVDGVGKWDCRACTLVNESLSNTCAACGLVNGESSGDGDGEGSSKGKRKSKFHRVRLGDGSAAALLDLTQTSDIVHRQHEEVQPDKGGGKLLPVRGVWRNGGGQRLLATTLKQPGK